MSLCMGNKIIDNLIHKTTMLGLTHMSGNELSPFEPVATMEYAKMSAAAVFLNEFVGTLRDDDKAREETISLLGVGVGVGFPVSMKEINGPP